MLDQDRRAQRIQRDPLQRAVGRRVVQYGCEVRGSMPGSECPVPISAKSPFRQPQCMRKSSLYQETCSHEANWQELD